MFCKKTKNLIIHCTCDRCMEIKISEFDAEVIDQLLEQYPRMWRDEVPKLDRIGKEIRNRKPIRLMREDLFRIANWKSVGRSERHLPKDSGVIEQQTQKSLEMGDDIEKVRYLTKINGVGLPIASAILRFVFPDKFGCVDWRNWFVLSQSSNEEGEKNSLFNLPLLAPLNNPYSSIEIRNDYSKYTEYLKIIRYLAEKYPERTRKGEKLPIISELKEYSKRTPAEIDMALFSYSWKFIKKS